jgi:hypothetical protein
MLLLSIIIALGMIATLATVLFACNGMAREQAASDAYYARSNAMRDDARAIRAAAVAKLARKAR